MPNGDWRDRADLTDAQRVRYLEEELREMRGAYDELGHRVDRKLQFITSAAWTLLVGMVGSLVLLVLQLRS